MTVLEAAELHPIMKYIRRRHATIAEKVACLIINELCVKEERKLSTSWSMRWRDQDVVNEPDK